MMVTRRLKLAACLLFVALFVVACVTSPTGRRQLMLQSPEAAIAPSQKAYLEYMQEFRTQNKLVTNPALVNRVETITGRLIGQAVQLFPESKDWKWSVAIVDEPETINAWCMAGGRMAIYTGIINQLKLTDDEIAQIMGHEIAHALANHTAERMSIANLANLGLLGVAIGTKGDANKIATAAIVAKLALELPYSRAGESEADRIGIELATRAGYDPEAAVSLWKKMGNAGGKGPPQFLSTHPSPQNRQQTLAALAPQMRQLNPTGRLAPEYPVQMMR